jgi:hypothetical protein
VKFQADHLIDGIAVEVYREMYFQDAFNDAMCVAVNLHRRPIKMERTGSKIVRHVHVEPQGREIPGPVAKLLGQSRFGYVEELEFDFSRNEGVWKTIPTILPDKVTSGGTLRFVGEGTGTRRIVHGEIEVRMFGIGGIVERFICSDAEKSYADAAEFSRGWVRQHPHG